MIARHRVEECGLRRLRGGQAVLIYYGVDDSSALVDEPGLEAIEAARALGSRIVTVTYTDAQRASIREFCRNYYGVTY
jgi:hypothetical protein